jgi:hypothetical protein
LESKSGEADRVELRVVLDPLAAQHEADEARAVERRQAREREQLRGRRHLGVAAPVVEADAEPAPAHLEAQLVRELEHAAVRGCDRVVEAVDAHAAERRAPGEPAERRRRLVHGHLRAAGREPVRQAEAEQPAADDAHRVHERALATAWRAMTRA